MLFNRKRALAFVISVILVLGLILIIYSSAGAKGFFGDFRSQEESVAYENLRIPVSMGKHMHKTLRVALPDNHNRMIFQLPETEEAVIRLGLVRIGDSAADSIEVRFRAYTGRLLWKKVLVDVSGRFSIGEHAYYRIENPGLSKGREQIEITCEIEQDQGIQPKGSETEREFAFIVPELDHKRKPGDFNVILISYDTLRPDHLGCYGYGRDTSPNTDAFAEKSVLFTQAISSSSWTSPAHYSLFTGLYPRTITDWKDQWEGMEDWKAFRILDQRKTLADTLRKNGYSTVGFVNKGPISSEFGFANGFNFYLEDNRGLYPEPGADGKITERIFGEAFQWLEENSDLKFFMFLHTAECHDPYFGDFFVSSDVTKNLIDHRVAIYDSSIRSVDRSFGALIRKLDALNIAEDTIIIISSDHGEEFYDHYTESDIIPPISEPITPKKPIASHSHSAYEELVRVALIFYVPGLESRKRVIENQVRLIDVFPTVLDFLGIELHGPMQGQSLKDLIRTGERDQDPPAIIEWNRRGPQRQAVRKDGYKYIWTENPERFQEWSLKNVSQFELFDLKDDPQEKRNIYDQNPDIAKEYHGILQEELSASVAIREILSRGQTGQEPENNAIAEDVIDQLRALGYLK